MPPALCVPRAGTQPLPPLLPPARPHLRKASAHSSRSQAVRSWVKRMPTYSSQVAGELRSERSRPPWSRYLRRAGWGGLKAVSACCRRLACLQPSLRALHPSLLHCSSLEQVGQVVAHYVAQAPKLGGALVGQAKLRRMRGEGAAKRLLDAAPACLPAHASPSPAAGSKHARLPASPACLLSPAAAAAAAGGQVRTWHARAAAME